MRVVRPASPRSTAAVGLVVGGLLAAAAVALPAAASNGTPPSTTRAVRPAAVRPAATTGTTTTGGKYTCSWAPSSLSRQTATSLSFRMPSSSMCIYPGPSSATIDVYASEADANARVNKVGSTVASWESEGTVSGLSPDTEYWWVGDDHSSWVRGPARTLAADPTTTTTTTTRMCTVAPTMLQGIGSTSLSFLRYQPSGCPSPGRITIDVYARKADAQARKRVVGTVSGDPGVVLVVDGLKPKKKYWYVTSDSGYVRGPVTTLAVTATTTTTPAGTCTAAYRVVSTWSGGFVAEVTVTAGSAPIGGWNLSWVYTGGQKAETAWGARIDQLPIQASTTWAAGTQTATTSGIATVSLHTMTTSATSRPPTSSTSSWLTDVRAANLPGNGSLAAGQSMSFGVLGSVPTGLSPTVPSVGCVATQP